MFQLSWSEYFFTAAVVIGIYYAIAALLLYSSEIITLAKSGFRKSPQPSTPAVMPPTPIMGEPRLSDVELIEERHGDLGEPIANTDDDGEPESLQPAGTSKSAILRQTAAALVSEADTVLQLVIELDSDRDETASLFNALLIRYPAIAASAFRATVSQTIVESINARLPFSVMAEEVDGWWNE